MADEVVTRMLIAYRFLGVDALWALAMALNVYLALFRGWTAQRMQAQEWKYFVGAYGLSFIPALTYLFLKNESRGRVYGPALVSTPCRISVALLIGQTALVLDPVRMGLPPHGHLIRHCLVRTKASSPNIPLKLTLYRVALVSAFAIYCLAFRKVWRNRRTLRPLFNPFNENPFGTITTEITVQSESRQPRSSSPASQYPLNNEDEEMRIPGLEGYHTANNTGFDPYTVNVEVGPHSKSHDDDGRKPSHTMAPELFRVRTLTRDHALAEANADAWLYARVAFLFFCALLISWVPSSINRVYSLAHPNKILYGLNYTETLVLPLQGFFNALVYIITSQTACRNLWRGMWGKGELPIRNPSMSGGAGPPEYGMGKGDSLKMERFTARRTSQRLESDVTSISSLRPH